MFAVPLLPNSVTSPPTEVNPVPPLPTGSVPVTPVLSGKPVQFVKTPLVGVPSNGVVRVGEVAKTSSPLPVSFVTAVARLALDGVAKNVATPVPNPETPVLIGSPVQLVSVPLDGVPSAGVTSVGEVAKTRLPVPVSSVTAVRRLALDGVPKNVATPAARPETPVEIGRPVQLVNTPAEGVPMFGVTSVADVASTTVLPEPVVVAAEIAVPLPANAGAVIDVVRVMAGVLVEFATEPAKPLAVTTETSETVPPPLK